MTEILLKLIVLGESGVGKTAILQQYINNVFTEDHKSTIGADFFTKKIDIGKNLITLQIWDTAGQERFKSLGKAFYRGANACILVFDITSKQSFEKIEEWKKQFESINNINNEYNDSSSSTSTSYPYLLLGNKSDLENNREITKNQAINYAKQNNMEYYETSAVNGENIKNAIFKIAEIASSVPSTPFSPHICHNIHTHFFAHFYLKCFSEKAHFLYTNNVIKYHSVFSTEAIRLIKDEDDGKNNNDNNINTNTGCFCVDSMSNYNNNNNNNHR